MEEYIGRIINGDCIEVMKTLSESSVDLIVTSHRNIRE
jgi:DNA modification methylase